MLFTSHRVGVNNGAG